MCLYQKDKITTIYDHSKKTMNIQVAINIEKYIKVLLLKLDTI